MVSVTSFLLDLKNFFFFHDFAFRQKDIKSYIIACNRGLWVKHGNINNFIWYTFYKKQHSLLKKSWASSKPTLKKLLTLDFFPFIFEKIWCLAKQNLLLWRFTSWGLKLPARNCPWLLTFRPTITHNKCNLEWFPLPTWP